MLNLLLLSCKFAAIIFCDLAIQRGSTAAYPIDSECLPCTSKDCILHAKNVLKHLKPDVDPCEDFFSFACGGYLEKFGKQDTKSVYDDALYSMQILIKDLLENLQPEKGTASEKLKMVFDTCMNEVSLEFNSVPVAIDFLNQLGMHNWPNLDTTFHFSDLSETLGKLAVYGEFAFVNIRPSPYEKTDSNTHSPSPAIILPGNYLLSSKMKPKDVENAVMRILSYFNVNKSESEIMWNNFKIIENIGISLKNEESRNSLGCNDVPRRSYTTLNCSEEKHDSMEFLCNVWKSAVRNGNLSKHYSKDLIHVPCHWNNFYYIENIFKTLVSLGNHRSLADYLSLRFLLSHLDDLNLYFRLTKMSNPESKPSETKAPETASRWEYCVEWTMKYMSLALGYEFTKEILTEPIQKDVLDMIQNYIQSLISEVENQNWIEQTVKSHLKRQLQKLDVGFLRTMNRFRNQTAVSEYYKEFYLKKDSFIINMLEYGKASVITKDKIHFNSFYTSSDPFTMDFGIALLLPPTYSFGLPKIWKYTTLGWLIGHELSHNLQYYLDLDDETLAPLKNKMQCFVDQYSQFVINKTGNTVTSNEAREEIIADNIGWKLTEKMLRKDVIDTLENFCLPGLNYTVVQLMYIAFAQDSCAVLSEELEKEYYKSKPHHLQKLRVLGILQNSKMFSDTFECTTSKVMNPEKKCVFFETGQKKNEIDISC